MVTPKDIKNREKKQIKDIIREIDKKLIATHGRYYDYESFSIDYMLSESIIKAIGKRYQKAGWTYIYYRKNYWIEKIDFIFSIRELEEKNVKNFDKL